MRLTAAALTAALVSAGMTAAGDWTQFRGPTGQGIAKVSNLPETWSETENVAWKTAIPGLGWSSPAVVKDRIYVTTAVPDGDEVQSLRAVCLDAATGSILWNQEIFRQSGPVEIHSKNSHASASPIVEGDRIYVHFGPHGTAALDPDGGIVWKKNELHYLPRHGVGGSPALIGDRLIICCDGHDQQFVAAISTASGDTLWRKDRNAKPAKGFSFGTPLLIEVDGRPQVICPGSNVVMALDPATGDEIWRAKYDGYSVVPRPIFAAGLIVMSTGYDDAQLLAIDPTGHGDVTESHVRWTVTRAAPNNPSPVAIGEDVYFVSDNGILSCVELATGQKRWQERLGGDYSASLLYADGKLYVQDEHGKAFVIRPGKAFELIAENTIAGGARTYASYAATDGALFIRSENDLYRIESPNRVADAKSP